MAVQQLPFAFVGNVEEGHRAQVVSRWEQGRAQGGSASTSAASSSGPREGVDTRRSFQRCTRADGQAFSLQRCWQWEGVRSHLPRTRNSTADNEIESTSPTRARRCLSNALKSATPQSWRTSRKRRRHWRKRKRSCRTNQHCSQTERRFTVLEQETNVMVERPSHPQ